MPVNTAEVLVPKATTNANAFDAPFVACPICASPSSFLISRRSDASCADRFAEAPKKGWDQVLNYCQCTQCAHVFTTDFDHWTDLDFRERIYNEHYVEFDPGYTGKRSRLVAEAIKAHLPPPIRVLDYGAGQADMGTYLAAVGYEIESFDPISCTSRLKKGWADVVIAIEVVEHSTKPWETFNHLARSVRPGGLIIVSTLLAPVALEHDAWWLAPRNGHVCAFSSQSLRRLMPRVKSVTPGVHYSGGGRWNEKILDDLCRSIDHAVLCER